MENIHLDLSEHEMDVMLNALEVAIENADEYEAGEYEEVLFDVQRKLDEEYDLGVESRSLSTTMYTIYTRNNCPYCENVKKVLTGLDESYMEIKLNRDFTESNLQTSSDMGVHFPES